MNTLPMTVSISTYIDELKLKLLTYRNQTSLREKLNNRNQFKELVAFLTGALIFEEKDVLINHRDVYVRDDCFANPHLLNNMGFTKYYSQDIFCELLNTPIKFSSIWYNQKLNLLLTPVTNDEFNALQSALDIINLNIHNKDPLVVFYGYFFKNK